MTITVWSGDLIIRDSSEVLGGKEVFLLPVKGDARRLSAAEARHALAFLGMVPSQAVPTEKPARVKLGGRDPVGMVRSHRVQAVMRVLYDKGDYVEPKELTMYLNPIPKGTISSVLADLLRYGYTERRTDPKVGYRVSDKGLEAFAETLNVAPQAVSN